MKLKIREEDYDDDVVEIWLELDVNGDVCLMGNRKNRKSIATLDNLGKIKLHEFSGFKQRK